MQGLHRIEGSLLSPDVLVHKKASRTQEKRLEATLQALADALEEREEKQYISNLVVQRWMDAMPKDSYTKAREMAVENFDCKMHAEAVFQQGQGNSHASYTGKEESVHETHGLDHHGIFAKRTLEAKDMTEDEQVSKKLRSI